MAIPRKIVVFFVRNVENKLVFPRKISWIWWFVTVYGGWGFFVWGGGRVCGTLRWFLGSAQLLDHLKQNAAGEKIFTSQVCHLWLKGSASTKTWSSRFLFVKYVYDERQRVTCEVYRLLPMDNAGARTLPQGCSVFRMRVRSLFVWEISLWFQVVFRGRRRWTVSWASAVGPPWCMVDLGGS